MKEIEAIIDNLLKKFTKQNLSILNKELKKYNLKESIDNSLEILNNCPQLKEIIDIIITKEINIEEFENLTEITVAYSIINEETIEIEPQTETTENTKNIDTSEKDMIGAIIYQATEYPLLTKEETEELFRQYQNGSKFAEEKLYLHNQRLVINIVKKYVGNGMSFEDLFQEGSCGLITAIRKFDISRGLRLSTYATWWIRQGITRALSEQSNFIRIPVHIHERISKLKKVQEKFYEKNGREATLEELSEILNWKKEIIVKLLNKPTATKSLNDKINDEDDDELLNYIKDERDDHKKMEELSLAENVVKFLDTLNFTAREKKILIHRLDIPGIEHLTLEQLGKIYNNITRERIRQIESKAKRKLFFSNKAREFCNLFPNSEYLWDSIQKYRLGRSIYKEDEDKVSPKPIDRPNLDVRVNVPIDKLKEIIAILAPVEQNLIAKLYDESFKAKDGWSTNDIKLMATLVTKIKKIANKEVLEVDSRKSKTLYQRIPCEKYILEILICTLTDSERDFVLEVFDKSNDYKRTNIVLTYQDSNYLNRLIQKLKSKINHNYLSWLPEYDTTDIKLQGLTPFELIIIMGIISGKGYDTQKIAKFLHVEERVILETTKSCLKKYYENENKLIYTDENIKLVRKKEAIEENA